MQVDRVVAQDLGLAWAGTMDKREQVDPLAGEARSMVTAMSPEVVPSGSVRSRAARSVVHPPAPLTARG